MGQLMFRLENEAIYVQSCHQGNVTVSFLEMKSVPKANAPGIFKAIRSALKFSDISENDPKLEKKLVGFGFDGANVNTGHLNGVISLFHQHISPSIVLIHCMAHRLELAFKQSMKGISVYEKVNTMLCELYKFYCKSALQMENLKTTYAALDIAVAIPHRIGGTRWVSHLTGALEQIWKGYQAFIQHLGEVYFN